MAVGGPRVVQALVRGARRRRQAECSRRCGRSWWTHRARCTGLRADDDLVELICADGGVDGVERIGAGVQAHHRPGPPPAPPGAPPPRPSNRAGRPARAGSAHVTLVAPRGPVAPTSASRAGVDAVRLATTRTRVMSLPLTRRDPEYCSIVGTRVRPQHRPNRVKCRGDVSRRPPAPGPRARPTGRPACVMRGPACPGCWRRACGPSVR